MKIQMICGNLTPGGRTTQVGMAVSTGLASLLGAEAPSEAVELSDVGAALFGWSDPAVAALTDSVMASDFIVLASPTYKASYTGLLKAFLDHFGAGSLHGRVVVPVMTGGSPAHSLAPDMALRPVLVELGASVPSTSLFFETSAFERMGEVVDNFINLNRYAFLGAAHGIELRRGGRIETAG